MIERSVPRRLAGYLRHITHRPLVAQFSMSEIACSRQTIHPERLIDTQSRMRVCAQPRS
jgi:hypothetical protein